MGNAISSSATNCPARRAPSSLTLALLVALSASDARVSEANSRSQGALKRLSLSELMDVEVTSVSRKPERLSRTAAALTVVRGEDIERSGVTSVADALRLAPGVHVSKINSSQWAVGIRGFSSRLSRSMLALSDGRSLYTPLFAGVYWQVQDPMLEDIDRIEVIRGPGGTLWGANAVNGVVNIITKPASETQGWLLTAGAGNEERGLGAFRYGGSAGDGVHYRVFGRYFDRAAGAHEDGSSFDDWRMGKTGFRLELGRSPDSQTTVIGNVYEGRTGVRVSAATYAPPFVQTFEEDTRVAGQNVLARWQRSLGNGGELELQAYYDRTIRDEPHFSETRDTYDLELRHRFPLSDTQELNWGAGYRASRDDVSAVETIVFSPASRTLELYSAFVQDEIELSAGRAWLTAGVKLEHQELAGLELQPSVRLALTPTPDQTIWFAGSRAVRTPSRLEHDLSLTSGRDPRTGIFYRVLGNEGFVSEKLTSWEAGYRAEVGNKLLLDGAIFYNWYDELLSLEPGEPIVEGDLTSPRTIVPFSMQNGLSGTGRGFELAGELAAQDWWRVRASYAFLDLDLRTEPGSLDPVSAAQAGRSPRHQASAWLLMQLPAHFELDAGLRAVGALESDSVPAYATADVRFAWSPNERWELSLVGRNLVDANHIEFLDGGHAVGVPRSFYGRIQIRY